MMFYLIAFPWLVIVLKNVHTRTLAFSVGKEYTVWSIKF